MFMGTTGSKTDDPVHVVTGGNFSCLRLRKRETEAEWIPWLFAYSLLCFKNTPPPTLFQTQGGGSERERGRERDSKPFLLASPSKDRQLGNYF